MNSNAVFGKLPAISILILSVGLANHVLIVPLILQVASRDSWMSPLLVCLIGLLWVTFPLFGTMKRLDEPFWSVVDRVMGKKAAWLLKAPILLLLVCVAFNTLVDSVSWSKTTYLPLTPNYVFALAMLGVSLYAVSKGLRTIAFTSAILLPFVLLLGDFVMSANMPHKDYHYLKPFLEEGWMPVLAGAALCACTMLEINTLVLFQHHVRNKFKLPQLLLLMLCLVLLTLGPLTGAIVQFGPDEAAKMRYPAFSQWRLVQIGKFVEHLDFFAIYQWLSGSLIRISLSLYLVKEMLGISKPKASAWYGWTFLAGLTPLVQFVTDHMVPYRKVMSLYFPISGLVVLIVSLAGWLIAVLAAKPRKDAPRRQPQEQAP
ncbi:endospore germination permease [Paenibacillus albicereus]|uniref:Endospore germination permease n=1 Tax=Paenibacillus albicereus TaxID=2726185 RepID=A0A6H2GVW0_9BACL|nr:endospore germination permease [Paenibacillus albicereus]QJC51535.1 endospore germination permease [Paenibacillus albicereus]